MDIESIAKGLMRLRDIAPVCTETLIPRPPPARSYVFHTGTVWSIGEPISMKNPPGCSSGGETVQELR